MANYNLGNLLDWEPVAIGEVIALDGPEASFRSVQFDVMSGAPVVVRVIGEEWTRVVGFGAGLVQVRFAIGEPFGVTFEAEVDEVYVRAGRGAQVLPPSENPSYATVTPRPTGPSAELARMMHLVRLNSLRREQAILNEVEVLRHQLRERPAAPPAAPAAPAAPSEVVEE